MKVNDAYICLDCEEVFDIHQIPYMCPACGSSTFYPVVKFLNREEVKDGKIERTNNR